MLINCHCLWAWHAILCTEESWRLCTMVEVRACVIPFSLISLMNINHKDYQVGESTKCSRVIIQLILWSVLRVVLFYNVVYKIIMQCWVLAIVSHEIHNGQWLYACMNVQISWGLQLLLWVDWPFFSHQQELLMVYIVNGIPPQYAILRAYLFVCPQP